MSVPSWERSESKSEYLRLLYDLNERIGQIVENKPKKYRGSYADMLIKTSLEALKFAQIANSIFMTKTTSWEDFSTRRKYLQIARGTVENISTVSKIFLNICKRADKESTEKIYKEKEYIGETCEIIHKKIGGIIKSDAALMKKK